MALLKGNILGNLSGRIGAVSARVVNGKTIIVSRPSSFKVSQTALAKQTRSRFSVTVTLINSILSFSDLRNIWNDFKKPGRKLRTTIFSCNYHKCAYNRPTVDNIITPGGFKLPVLKAEITEGSLDLELEALHSASDFTAEETGITFTTLLIYFDPINPNDKHYRIIKLVKHKPDFNFDTASAISLPIDVSQQEIEIYQNSIILTAALSKNINGAILQYSSTFAKDF